MPGKKILSERIRRLAATLGIDAIGFANTAAFSGYPLKTSIRRDPKQSMPSAKTIIVAGIYIGGFTLAVWQNALYGRTSRLFLSGFFLDVVKPLGHKYEHVLSTEIGRLGTILLLA